MNNPKSVGAIVDPVIALVPHAELRGALYGAFSEEHAAVGKIEEFFKLLPSSAWPPALPFQSSPACLAPIVRWDTRPRSRWRARPGLFAFPCGRPEHPPRLALLVPEILADRV